MAKGSSKLTRHDKPWTEYDVKRLASAANKGLRVKQAAERLGRTPGATQQAAMRHGINFR